MDIIRDIFAYFGDKTVNLLETSNDLSVSDLQEILKPISNEIMVQSIRAYYESQDKKLLADKQKRKECGMVVERRNDRREVITDFGVVAYKRTYYKMASGGYDYPIDDIVGIEPYSRVCEGTAEELVADAIDESYAKASIKITGGLVSKQTVMNYIRKAYVPNPRESEILKKVPELHIDADEDHVTLSKSNGKSAIVPLITVYEGIQQQGKRNVCVNSFSISDFDKTPDEIWENVLFRIEAIYDIQDTRIYIHGDGAAWIKQALEWFPGAIFVLDPYHKNKYIKQSIAGFTGKESTEYQGKIQKILKDGKKEDLLELQAKMCEAHPERKKNILKSIGYLYNNFEAIVIRNTDSGAHDCGCTEPHVSNTLSLRLSSRPMAWSGETLKHFAPILAAKKFTFDITSGTISEEKIVDIKVSKTRHHKQKSVKNSLGLPDPDKVIHVANSFNGKKSNTYCAIKLLL